MTNRLLFGCALALLGPGPGASAATGGSSSSAGNSRYAALVQARCDAMERKVKQAEDYRQLAMDYAKAMGDEKGGVRSAWYDLEAQVNYIEQAHASIDNARAMVNPAANLNNAMFLVQKSNQKTSDVGRQLGMNMKELFGFNPPPDWNGAMPGDKPATGMDPDGSTEPAGAGSGAGGEGAPSSSDPAAAGRSPGAAGGMPTLPAGDPGSAGEEGGGQETIGGAGGGGGGPGDLAMLDSGGGAGGLPESGVVGLPGGPGSAAMAGGAGGGRDRRPEAAPRRRLAWGKGRPKGEGFENPLRGASGSPDGAGAFMSYAAGPMSADTAQAWRLDAQGQYADAQATAKDSLRRDPKDAKAYGALAWAELRLGEYKDAEADATRAIELDPKDARAYRIRAYARQMLGDRKGMLADIEMAARLEAAYEKEAEAARRGGDIYDSSKEDEQLLAPEGKGSPLKRFGLLALLAAGVAGGTAFFVRRARRKAA